MSRFKELMDKKLTNDDGQIVGYVDFRKLMQLVAEVLADGQLDHNDMPGIIEYVQDLFERHVRPFDIPGIGPILERFVDDAMYDSIEPILNFLCEKYLCKEPHIGGDVRTAPEESDDDGSDVELAE